MNEHAETLAQIKSTVIDLVIKFGPRVLVAIVIMIAGYFAGRWVGRIMQRGLLKIDLEPPVRDLLVRVVRIFVLGLFAIMALQNLGVELLPLIAGVGLAGAGIALAMQGVLGNLVAGLTIIFTRPFRVGEYISMLGVEGKVETISLFNSVLSHPDLSRVVIPNRKIVGEILQANPLVLKDPPPVVAVSVLADSSINIAVKPWSSVVDYGPAAGEINKAIVETFRARAIIIPFPQREVRMLA